MGNRVHHRFGPAIIGGLFIVLAVQGVTARTAWATCGDWLAHSGDMQISAENANASGAHSGQSARKQDSSTARLPISKPCNGPYCRSAPFPSAPASPVSISLPSDRLLVVANADVELTSSSRFQSVREPDACPTPGFKERIEHPPRA
jgi:hypothetical protein